MRAAIAALFVLCTGAQAAGPEDVVISELLIRGASAPEWIELSNPSPTAVALTGCELVQDGVPGALSDLSIPAGGAVVVSDGGACVEFDSNGDCLHPDVGGAALDLPDTGSGTVRLRCGAQDHDAVTFDWQAVAAQCVGADTCAVQVRPENLSPVGNESWPGSWCLPPTTASYLDALERPALGTPGRPNICAAAGCGTGDLVISELMVDPPGGDREWIELAAQAACDLQGCELREGPFADPFAEPSSPDWTVHVIDAPGSGLPVLPGTYLLLADDAGPIAGPAGDPAAVPVDYTYGAIHLGNSEPAWLHLVCAGTAVDSAPYDWSRWDATCTGACTLNLPLAQEDATSNDDPGLWCLPPDSSTWTTPEGGTFSGTPGQPGACVVRPWPRGGDLLFTELMVSPEPSRDNEPRPEWVELRNRTGGAFTLEGCALDLLESGPDGRPVDATADRIVLSGGDLDWGPEAVRVLSDGGCVDGTSPAPDCPFGERPVAGLGLTNDGRRWVRLSCPLPEGGEVIVDEAPWELALTNARAGHSVEFPPGVDDPVTTNDDPLEWCEASFLDCYVGEEEVDCNFGTPGEAGPCATSQVAPLPSGPGCRCSGGAGPTAVPVVVSLLPWLRRRRR